MNTEIQPLRRILSDGRGPRPPAVLPLSFRLTRAAIRAAAPFAPDYLTAWLTSRYFQPVRHRAPRRELEVLATARSFRPRSPFGELATYVWSHGAVFPWERRQPAGTVLLVHGWSGRATQLQSFIEPLNQRGYRVVAFDAPGHGASPGVELDVPTYAAALRWVADELGPISAAIAHSVGGASLATALADDAAIERAVLIGAPARFDAMFELYTQSLGLKPDLVERIRRAVAARLGDDIWDRLDVARIAPALRAAGLIIHDVDDAEVPFEAALKIAKAWPNARLIATAGLGHRRLLRDQAVLEEVVRFVTRGSREHGAAA